MIYPEAIRYLESFVNYERLAFYPYKTDLKLGRIKGFLEKVGNPHLSLKCLHVAGTKGKGSTCAFLAYILKEAGYKVGLYTSPHLSDFRERIRILSHQSPATSHQPPDFFEGMISREGIEDFTGRLRPKIDEYNEGLTPDALTFFEVYTALAFSYFKEQKVDFAVLETGMGGRLDATNVAEPLACAITPVSYEHTDKLGSTLKEIAAEKAGIIKGHRSAACGHRPVVVSAGQEEEAMRAIEDKCASEGAELFKVGRDITYCGNNENFKVKGFFAEYTDLKIHLIGAHQLANAALAVGVIEALNRQGIQIGKDAISAGLKNTKWPGRCEVVSSRPLVVLDGAQNIASARALAEAVKKNFTYEKLILVLGISSDKDKAGLCSELYGLAHEVILTKSDSPRAEEPASLAGYFQRKNVHITAGVKEAKELAGKIAGKKDLVLVTGSLFLVGEFRA